MYLSCYGDGPPLRPNVNSFIIQACQRGVGVKALALEKPPGPAFFFYESYFLAKSKFQSMFFVKRSG